MRKIRGISVTTSRPRIEGEPHEVARAFCSTARLEFDQAQAGGAEVLIRRGDYLQSTGGQHGKRR